MYMLRGTPLIRAPLGFYAKVGVWKLDLNVKRQYFRYMEYINWLQIDEILTCVFMYGGPSISFLRYGPLKNDVTILTPFLA